MRALTITIFTAFLSLSPAIAQNQNQNREEQDQPTEESFAKPFWKASLPGGEYMVHLSRLSSVSMHTYVVDGVARVTEMTVASSGSVVTRFYYLEGVTDGGPSAMATNAVDRLKEVQGKVEDRTGSNMSSEVVKNYPTTTHSHTVEYRLPEKSNITFLYSSLKRAWERGKGSKITIK